MGIYAASAAPKVQSRLSVARSLDIYAASAAPKVQSRLFRVWKWTFPVGQAPKKSNAPKPWLCSKLDLSHKREVCKENEEEPAFFVVFLIFLCYNLRINMQTKSEMYFQIMLSLQVQYMILNKRTPGGNYEQ